MVAIHPRLHCVRGFDVLFCDVMAIETDDYQRLSVTYGHEAALEILRAAADLRTLGYPQAESISTAISIFEKARE
jgi:hypothetical protein